MEDLLGIEVSHISKLKKIFRSAFHIGSTVDQKSSFLSHRKCRSHRCSADSSNTLDDQCCAGEKCAGASCGNDSISLAVTEKVQRYGHGGVLLASCRSAGIIFHGDHFTGINHFDIRCAFCSETALHFLFFTNKHHIDVKLFGCTYSTFYDLFRCIIATHCVNYYSHIRKTSLFLIALTVSSARLDNSRFLFLFPFTR